MYFKSLTLEEKNGKKVLIVNYNIYDENGKTINKNKRISVPSDSVYITGKHGGHIKIEDDGTFEEVVPFWFPENKHSYVRKKTNHRSYDSNDGELSIFNKLFDKFGVNKDVRYPSKAGRCFDAINNARICVDEDIFVGVKSKPDINIEVHCLSAKKISKIVNGVDFNARRGLDFEKLAAHTFICFDEDVYNLDEQELKDFLEVNFLKPRVKRGRNKGASFEEIDMISGRTRSMYSRSTLINEFAFVLNRASELKLKTIIVDAGHSGLPSKPEYSKFMLDIKDVIDVNIDETANEMIALINAKNLRIEEDRKKREAEDKEKEKTHRGVLSFMDR